MKIKSFFAKPFANYIYKQIKKGMETAVQDQQSIFNHLMKDAAKTVFGKEHQFELIKSHQDFVKLVPIRDYEEFKPYSEIYWLAFPQNVVFALLNFFNVMFKCFVVSDGNLL